MIGAVLESLAHNRDELLLRLGEHIMLTGFSTLMAVAVGIPLGIWAAKSRHVEGPLLATVGVLQTIPSLAMLALLLALLQKIGALPAIIALTLYALLPIVRNTLAGITGIAPELREAARGIGMTPRQQLRLIELPLALPIILTGVRTAAVVGVGVATLAAFIGAGGLGQFINRGLALVNTELILLGAIPSALLAISVDWSLGAMKWGLIENRQARAGSIYTLLRARVAIALPMIILALGIGIYLAQTVGTGFLANGQTQSSQAVIRVGSKNFSEQLILGELMAQLLEHHTRLRVERRFNLGGTMINHSAIVAGEIDIYPEYTGTALIAIMKGEVEQDPQVVYGRVKAEYEKRYGLTWLKPFGFNNSFAIAVRRADQKAKGWRKISDLSASASGLRAGFAFEFATRKDGYPGLSKLYDIKFGRVIELDLSLLYSALQKGQMDVIAANATDGRLAAYDLFVLADDRHYFPPYFAAPVVRRAVLAAHPAIARALGLLDGHLDETAMRKLNWQVDGQKKLPRDVARTFLQKRGLLKARSN